VTDQDVFDRANEEFEQANAKGTPFFSLVLTLSNHAPFDLPEPLPFERTTDMGEMNKRIDGMRYADWAVGHFIEEAKKREYFKNTLFIFVGDHGFHVTPKLTEAHLLFHHVPLLFYAPSLLSQKGVVISSAAAQMNILPTVMGLLGMTGPQSSWGRDLFAKREAGDENPVIFKGSGGSGSDQAVVMIRGEKLLCVGSTGTTQLYRYALNPDPMIEPLNDPASVILRDQMHREMNAYIQSAMADLTGFRGGSVGPSSLLATQQPARPAPGAELLHETTPAPTPRQQ
jgi:membrane-anchored protein YejM (alkaline phosphatase superfamily)